MIQTCTICKPTNSPMSWVSWHFPYLTLILSKLNQVYTFLSFSRSFSASFCIVNLGGYAFFVKNFSKTSLWETVIAWCFLKSGRPTVFEICHSFLAFNSISPAQYFVSYHSHKCFITYLKCILYLLWSYLLVNIDRVWW